jgi:hypothetical protein
MAKLYLSRLGGGNRELLADGQPAATTGERAKFAAMGGVLLTTAGVATVSMFFAVHNAVGANVGWSIVLGLAWGIVILNLDRFLVVTMNGARDRKWQMAITVLLRLLLAALVAMVVSMPLVLQVFAGDVNSELPLIAAQKSEQYKTAILKGPIEQQITVLNERIATEEAVLNGKGSAREQADQANVDKLTSELQAAEAKAGTANQKVQCEIGGLKQGCPPGTSGIAGNGPRAKADKAALQAYEAQVTLLGSQLKAANAALTVDQKADEQNKKTNQQELTANQKTLAQLQGELNSDITNDRNKNNADHDLLAQVQALFAASGQSFGLNVAHWLVTLLFFSIELLPVGVKTMLLLGPKTAYETIAEEADQEAISNAQEKIRQRNSAELEIARLEAQAMVDKRRLELEISQTRAEAEYQVAYGKVDVDKRAEADMRTREEEIRLWANQYVDKRSRRYIKAMLAAWAQMIDEKISQAYPQQTMNGHQNGSGQQSRGGQQNANSQGPYSQQQPNAGYNLPNGGGGVI